MRAAQTPADMPADASSACAKLTDPDKSCELVSTARAETHRFGVLSALRAHTKAPCKTDLLWRTLRVTNRPERARTDEEGAR